MNQNQEIYDIAIIGGGITGAGIAREAAMRGAKAIVFEKNAIGSGTSSKSSKLIHGGLRYLETAWIALLELRLDEFWKNLHFVFVSLRETFILQKIAPEIVTSIPLLLPIYQSGKRSRAEVFFGTFLYGLFARMAGGDWWTQILWNKEAVLKKIPALNPEGLLGGVIIYDHTADDLKLVQETMASAVRRGTVLMEHAEVTHYTHDLARKLYRIEVRQQGLTKTFFAFRLINASGHWIDTVRKQAWEDPETELITPVAGSHLNLKKFAPYSIILEAPDKRIFFVVNRGDTARAGTTERLENNPENPQATTEEIQYLLSSLQFYFPSLGFTEKDILSSDAGIRPLVKPTSPTPLGQISREHKILEGPSGVFHIAGVKLTDHRRASEEVLRRLMPELQAWNTAIHRTHKTRKIPLSD